MVVCGGVGMVVEVWFVFESRRSSTEIIFVRLVRAEHSITVSHWLINIFYQHPDQKEGQGLAVFDRSNEGLKIIRKKNEYDGNT
jgi:hypothetical protein